jgi:hypothetical protein
MKAAKLILAMLVVACAVVLSRAATITVTSLADSGPGTLRAAINDSPANGTIIFAPGLVGTISLTNGKLEIRRPLTITGPGAAMLKVSGSYTSRVFHIFPDTPVNISALTIANGGHNGLGQGEEATGGGILNQGALVLERCIILGNTAYGGIGSTGGRALGGGICSRSTNGIARLTLVGCTFCYNLANGGGGDMLAGDAWGGAVYASGALVLTNCTFALNLARGGGGGSGPGGFGLGGALFIEGSDVGSERYMVGCTISTNTARGGDSLGSPRGAWAGGVYLIDASLRPMSTIVSGNELIPGRHPTYGTLGSSGDPDICLNPLADSPGVLLSGGYNLIGAWDPRYGSDGPWVSSDLVGTTNTPLDAVLGPLQDNGGPTPTMAPRLGSPAIDYGHRRGMTTDQRGFVRPVDLPDYANASGGDGSDIGAVEVQPCAVDIGLRMFDGTATNRIACEVPGLDGSLVSPLRIAKNGTNYGIVLVETNAADASKIQVKTLAGVKAWMKLP